MAIRKLTALAMVGAMRSKHRVVFATNVGIALLVAGLTALNVVAIERAATDGKMSPINVAVIATQESSAAADLPPSRAAAR